MAPSVYTLNLLDLQDHEDHRGYLRISGPLVARHGGTVISIGKICRDHVQKGGHAPTMMVLVAWESAEAFESFKLVRSAEHARRLRELGARNYLWWSSARGDGARSRRGRAPRRSMRPRS